MKKLIPLTLCAVAAAFSTGCLINSSGTFQSSSKPVEQGKYTVLGSRVSGTDSQYTILGFHIARPGNPALRALDDAKSKAPNSDALIEVGTNVELLLVGPLQVTTTRVSGIPVKTTP